MSEDERLRLHEAMLRALADGLGWPLDSLPEDRSDRRKRERAGEGPQLPPLDQVDIETALAALEPLIAEREQAARREERERCIEAAQRVLGVTDAGQHLAVAAAIRRRARALPAGSEEGVAVTTDLGLKPGDRVRIMAGRRETAVVVSIVTDMYCCDQPIVEIKENGILRHLCQSVLKPLGDRPA